ncbi:protein-tyrosine phosphatase family protein [Haloarcula litorea]|uniref:protein-tyrosine phosphatase family protein n=1 Tax=Haloarcula litorea TaxID=3032579 RepID=UPI0023E8D634|nr:dual specificity protein phosphatase family protein [Halomicroarcula sp. GDY20]
MRPANAHRFAPAAPDESTVFGACAPGWHAAADHAVALDDWLAAMRRERVERVCCLLPGRQLDATDANLDRYADALGESNVLHAPVPDHHLLPEPLLHDEILPFLAAADAAEERTVVHCLAGIGRTGQVLAAWLVYSRDYGPDRAVETVREQGRDPLDAVRAGNATREELDDLLVSVTGR